jgi:hypothetical protein
LRSRIRNPHARPGCEGPAPCSIAPTLSHWRYVNGQLMIVAFPLFCISLVQHKNLDFSATQKFGSPKDYQQLVRQTRLRL